MQGSENLKQLEQFLLGAASVPPLSTLLAYRLGPYAYSRLSAGHPAREALRQEALLFHARHAATRASLLPLFQAWRQAGIDVLLFKGFYLAEFVYPTAQQRFYGDVDIVLKPEQSHEARAIAQALGWVESWNRHDAPNKFTHAHEEAHFDLPGKNIRLDIHRFIIHCQSPLDGLQRRVTEAAWAASHEQAWGNTSLRVLEPLDSILIGLVLNRAWSDGWHLKTHDLLDFQNLLQRYAISEEALLARAEVLGCAHTLRLFLVRCNPWQRRLDLSKPSEAQRQWLNLAVAHERGHRGMEQLFRRAYSVPGLVTDIRKQLPTLRRVLSLLEREDDIGTIVKRLNPAALQDPLTFAEKERVARGIKWGMKFLRPWQQDHCLPVTLALFAVLRAHGHQVGLMVGKEGTGQLHARLELGEERLESLGKSPCPVTTEVFSLPFVAAQATPKLHEEEVIAR